MFVKDAHCAPAMSKKGCFTATISCSDDFNVKTSKTCAAYVASLSAQLHV